MHMKQHPSRFAIQDAQYQNPYHHFVSIDVNDPRQYVEVSWGLEYYGYVTRVLEHAETQPCTRVAEVGCGDGKILYEFAKQHPEVICEGFDLSPQAIAFASAYGHGISNLSFYEKDFSKSAGLYDVIFCVETMEHIPDEEVEGFMEALRAKLAPHGRIIITVPTTNRPLRAKHYRHYDHELLAAHIPASLDIVFEEFLHNDVSAGCHFIQALLANRLWLLRTRIIRKWLFGLYVTRYRIASAHTGAHLLVVAAHRAS